MSTQDLILHIPEPLYRSLKRQADQASRSIEEETLELLASAVPCDPPLKDSAEIRDSLQVLDDASLWKAARGRLAAEVSADLETLHHKRQREGLTPAEETTLAGLMRHYERHLLVRAQAAALLKARGHDVGEVVSS
ncbi:MAG: hypothetical protein U0793_34165 [Gemmataceae bacterium]